MGDAPGITIGQAPAAGKTIDMWSMTGSYTPTLVEWTIFFGIVSLGILAFIMACRRLLWADRDTIGAVGAPPVVE